MEWNQAFGKGWELYIKQIKLKDSTFAYSVLERPPACFVYNTSQNTYIRKKPFTIFAKSSILDVWQGSE